MSIRSSALIRSSRSVLAASALCVGLCLATGVAPGTLAAQSPSATSELDLTSFRMPRPARQATDATKLPPFLIEFSLGAGNFEHDTEGTNLDGDTDAPMFRFRFEGYGSSGFGGGVEIELIASDDDIFAANGFGESEARVEEIFGYGAYRVHDDRFTMPLRFGLFGRRYEIEQQSPGAEVEITSFGIKVQAEPDYAFVVTERVRFSAFANVAFGFGASEVETSLTSTKWDTSTVTFGLDAGVRLRLGLVTLALAYVHREEAIDQSDVENGTFVRAIDTDFDGVAFTVGFVF